MAPVVISFSDHTATPPVFVAGSFTDWKAVEIVATEQGQGQYLYEKTFDLNPGTYQYKFRLGSGDWWACDNQAPRTQDAFGNENNVIVVEAKPVQSVADSSPVHIAVTNDHKDDDPVVNSTSKLVDAGTIESSKESATATVPLALVDDEADTKVNGVATTQNTAEEEVPKPPEAEKLTESAMPVETVDTVTEKEVESKNASIPQLEDNAIVNGPSEAQQALKQPSETKVNGSASPKSVIKKTGSKASSISSTAPVKKSSDVKGNKSEKPNWFARIFLCGSSRKVMLAAVAVTFPIFVAYIIKK